MKEDVPEGRKLTRSTRIKRPGSYVTRIKNLYENSYVRIQQGTVPWSMPTPPVEGKGVSFMCVYMYPKM